MRRAVQVAVLPLAVFGCAPLASFRPASGLMPGRTLEVGAGAAAVSPRPYVEEPWRGAGQVWMTGDAGRSVSFSAIGAFDTDAVALGGAVRLNWLRTGRVAAGLEGELGFAWAGFSVPLAARVFDETWVYTAPRAATWSNDVLGSVPLGLSARIVDGFILRGEAQVSWQDFKYYNRRTHLGGGVAYQW